MKFTKPATTIEFQINQLKERGLVIKNEELAKSTLSHISYFRLAAYWWPLQYDKNNHLFKPNSNFETVIKIYQFDLELRKLIFDMIQEIEISLRTKLSYYLSQELSPWWFEDSANFINEHTHATTLSTIDKDLKLNKKKEVFLSEHYKKYHSDTRRPPSWKTLEVVSLGALSKLYGNLSSSCKSKDKIAASFGTVNHTYFHSWAQDISQIRNICAHHGRIWNKNLPGRPKMMSAPPNSWLKQTPSVQDHEKLYIHLCCMKYIVNTINPNNNYTYRLFILLKRYQNIDWNALGIPKEWFKEDLWNNRMAVRYPIKTFLFKVRFIVKNVLSI